MLLEAVPNLSMGPGSRALSAVRAALDRAANPGWALLDVHSDVDHNRSVLTLAGAPAPLAGALAAMVDAALEQGTLVGHAGVHPRLGLVDVVPLVPLHDAREADAKRTALAVASRLARRDVPVHFYGRLARAPQRATLSFLRRELARTVGPPRDDLAPDLGPPLPHPRYGASCVGVRGPLVAYNVLLETKDAEAGREIARALREPASGLAGVKALSFALPSRGARVQVSCNVTAPDQTGLADVYARVGELAGARGIRVVGGELVGLAPRGALADDPVAMGLAATPASLEQRLAARGLPATIAADISPVRDARRTSE